MQVSSSKAMPSQLLSTPLGMMLTSHLVCCAALLQAFLRGILANWLVCCAVWCAGAASSLPAKVMGIWPPIAAFVAIGLEHSVANMFIIPMGIALGADVAFKHFLTSNLVPVTLGNIVGGMVFMATSSSFFFGSLGGHKPAKA